MIASLDCLACQSPPISFTAAWETFFRTTRRLRSRAGRQPIEGLSLPQYHLLEALRDAAELTVGVLAEAAGVAAADRHAHARLPRPRRLCRRAGTRRPTAAPCSSR